MSEINPITSTSFEKMTGAGVHHVEHSKKFRDPSFEHIRIYVGNSSIKKHIQNTVGVIVVTPGICNSGFYKRIICSYHPKSNTGGL